MGGSGEAPSSVEFFEEHDNGGRWRNNVRVDSWEKKVAWLVKDLKEMDEIIGEYRNKRRLVPQDIIKCYLKVHQKRNNVSFYDYRVKLWWIRPGDVVFVNGCFCPVVSYPRIDDTLHGVECGHVKEMKESRHRIEVRCECRKWYLYYRLDNGKVKRMCPAWDGLTCIPAGRIKMICDALGNHKDMLSIKFHFTDGIMTRKSIDDLLSDIRSFEQSVLKRGIKTSASSL